MVEEQERATKLKEEERQRAAKHYQDGQRASEAEMSKALEGELF